MAAPESIFKIYSPSKYSAGYKRAFAVFYFLALIIVLYTCASFLQYIFHAFKLSGSSIDDVAVFVFSILLTVLGIRYASYLDKTKFSKLEQIGRLTIFPASLNVSINSSSRTILFEEISVIELRPHISTHRRPSNWKLFLSVTLTLFLRDKGRIDLCISNDAENGYTQDRQLWQVAEMLKREKGISLRFLEKLE